MTTTAKHTLIRALVRLAVFTFCTKLIFKGLTSIAGHSNVLLGAVAILYFIAYIVAFVNAIRGARVADENDESKKWGEVAGDALVTALRQFVSVAVECAIVIAVFAYGIAYAIYMLIKKPASSDEFKASMKAKMDSVFSSVENKTPRFAVARARFFEKQKNA